MSNESNKINSGVAQGLIDSLNRSQATQTEAKKSPQEVGKDQFLQLLVTQLKNQDPMNPMENQEFAVQLAQFSQLEQLIEINKSVSGGTENLSSLTGYLGNEVYLKSNEVQVENHNGGLIKFDLANGAKDVKIELLSKDGAVKETVELGGLSSGKHTISLDDLKTSSGAYSVQVTATSTTGAEFNPDVLVGGMVSGVIPGQGSVLLVGGREVNISEILEVNLPQA